MTTNKGFSERVENWLGVIPGIGTYRQRENLRETDHKLREYIFAQLQEMKYDLEKIILELAGQKKMDMLPNMEAAVAQLQKVADNIKFANYGYTGIFDLKKIREDELKKIYDFDLSLLEDINKMQALVEGLKKNGLGDKLLAKFADLQTSFQALDKKFRQRSNILSQYG